MEDIASRLRWAAENDPLIDEVGYGKEMVEAADEIDRLRAVLSSVYHDLDRISRSLAGSWGDDD